MESYRSRSGKPSGVTGYEIGENYITVSFINSSIYKYTYTSAGSSAVERMKRLAKAQLGLNTYISQYKPSYTRLL